MRETLQLRQGKAGIRTINYHASDLLKRLLTAAAAMMMEAVMLVVVMVEEVIIRVVGLVDLVLMVMV